MKRYFCLLSLLITCTGFLSAEAIQIGDYYYNLNDANKTAEFTTKQRDTYRYVSTVEIPSSVVYNGSTYKVTRIADWTFSSTNLSSITIPNSVTSIGGFAFYKCTSLKSITIPENLKVLEGAVFEDCTNLSSVVWNAKNCSNASYSTFEGCYMLSSFTFGKNVKEIPAMICYHLYGLKEIILPEGVTTIGERAFEKCSGLKSVTIPNTVKTIGGSAFKGCSSLISVTIPNSVDSIGSWAFQDCTNLSSVVWNANNCSLKGEYGIFKSSNITSFTFCSDIKEIPHGICEGMKKLTEVEIPYGVTIINNSAFYGCSSLLSVTIPNSVDSIGIFAFDNCSSLKSITIPQSVTTIDKAAFSGCTGLTSIDVSPENPNYSSWDGALYNKDHTILYAYPNKKGTSYVIPSGVTTICKYALHDCTNLISLTIPNSVTNIEKDAFYDCKNLWVYTASNVSIPNISSNHIIRLSLEELLLRYPFPAYAKNYVEKHINQWQQRGEFERTAEWQARVNEETRQQKINELLAEAERKYTDYYKQSTSLSLTLGRYDADNEVFVITDTKYGNIYMAVPYKEAQKFKENWYNKNVSYELQIKDGEIGLASVSILMPKRKQYTYRNTDAVTYNLEELDYDFAPINLNFAQTSPQNQQNASPAKRKAVKSLIDTDIPTTEASNPNTFVIIFANEDYKNVASVPFAKNDGAVFQKYCQKTLGIPTSNIHYVENASYNDIRIQLAWLNDVCDAFDGNASIIVYYSGHGIPDEASKSAYLLPVDGDGRYVQSAYKVDDLYQKLGAMNTKSVTIFMDACFSGATRSNTMVAQAKGVALKAKNSIPQGRTVVFSAAQGDESAGFFEEEGHGLFTYYLLKKLQETKGDVSLQDLGEYIITNVRKQSIVNNGKSQTPCVTPSPSATDWQNWKLK